MCVVPLPPEVRGVAGVAYGEAHGDSLKAFCKPVVVSASPTAQAVMVPVELPVFIPDQAPPAGSGSAN